MESVWNTGIHITQLVQLMGHWPEKPMKILSMLGVEEFYMLLLFLFYWCIDTSAGIRLGTVLLLSDAVNTFFKLLFHHPRPYWYSSSVRAYSVERSFGLPSGHAQNAAAVWGMLAAVTENRIARGALVMLIILISFSRIYLGVHFITDVLMGWIIGIILLYTVLKLYGPAAAQLEKYSLEKQLLAALFVSAAMFFAQLVPLLVHPGWIFPHAWAQNILWASPGAELPDPRKISGIISGSGAALGLCSGLAFMKYYGGYSTEGSVKQKAIRLLAGIAVAALIYAGLKEIFPGGKSFEAGIFRYIRYALVGLWITFGAPCMFIRLGLAEKADNTGTGNPIYS